MPNQTAWWVVPGSSLRWRQWDGEFLLYHDDSGDTHRLNPLGARVVRRLAEARLTAGDLAGQLATEFDAEPGPDFMRAIEQLLARLYDLGLVEPTDRDDSREPEPLRAR